MFFREVSGSPTEQTVPRATRPTREPPQCPRTEWGRPTVMYVLLPSPYPLTYIPTPLLRSMPTLDRTLHLSKFSFRATARQNISLQIMKQLTPLFAACKQSHSNKQVSAGGEKTRHVSPVPPPGGQYFENCHVFCAFLVEYRGKN